MLKLFSQVSKKPKLKNSSSRESFSQNQSVIKPKAINSDLDELYKTEEHLPKPQINLAA